MQLEMVMNAQSSAHILKRFSVNPVWLVSIGVAVLFHAAGAVAVVRAPENGLVSLVDGMLHHITIRETIEFEPIPTPVAVIPAPEPAPAPEEVEIAKAKKTNDQPGGTPQAQPQTKPAEPVAKPISIPSISEPTPVSIALPTSAPKAAPKAPKKPKAKPASKPAPKPEPAPVVVAAAEPLPAPQAVVPFEKATSATPAVASAVVSAASATDSTSNTTDGADNTAHGAQGGTPSASNAAAVGAHGVGGGAGSGGTDEVDRKGLMKEYLKQINAAVRQHYVYPRMAQRMRLEGTATVAVTIDAAGHITKAEIVESSGHEVLDEAALEAVLALGDVPAPPEALAWSERTVKIPYRFSLRQG